MTGQGVQCKSGKEYAGWVSPLKGWGREVRRPEGEESSLDGRVNVKNKYRTLWGAEASYKGRGGER